MAAAITEQAASDLALLADLRALRFKKCYFEGRSVAHLGKLVYLKKLSILDPSQSAPDMVQLRMALPSCEVTPAY